MYLRGDAPFKTVADVRKSKVGSRDRTGTGTTSHYLPTLLNDGIGTKFHVVTGYPGGPEIDLAVERNEVQCRAFTIAGWFTGDLYATGARPALPVPWCRAIASATRASPTCRQSMSCSMSSSRWSRSRKWRIR